MEWWSIRKWIAVCARCAWRIWKALKMGKSTRAYCKTNTIKWHNEICRSSHRARAFVCPCLFGTTYKSARYARSHIHKTCIYTNTRRRHEMEKNGTKCIYAGVWCRQQCAARRALREYLLCTRKTVPWHTHTQTHRTANVHGSKWMK